MNGLLCDEGVVMTRQGLRRIYHDRAYSGAGILEIIAQEGLMLKHSGKARVRRVGAWVVKESQGSWARRLVRHTLLRGRYRRAWLAAHHLAQHGVLTPGAIAYMETSVAGLVLGNMQVFEYLEDYRNVERFLLALVQRGAGRDTISMFLRDLADAVNRLTVSGAYHADLSGKNILTRDGTEFYFIDLDAVSLNTAYTDELRMRNHVQLYDSFCDLLNDAMLVPFIERMLTERHNPRVWMPGVRKGQHARRLRTEKLWARQGKAPQEIAVEVHRSTEAGPHGL